MFNIPQKAAILPKGLFSLKHFIGFTKFACYTIQK